MAYTRRRKKVKKKSYAKYLEDKVVRARTAKSKRDWLNKLKRYIKR